VNNHHIREEGEQEAAIEGFLVAHEGHTQEVELQRGTWSIYCLCKRCGEIHTYEVDNEARQQALGLPPWQEEDKEEALFTQRPRKEKFSEVRGSKPLLYPASTP